MTKNQPAKITDALRYEVLGRLLEVMSRRDLMLADGDLTYWTVMGEWWRFEWPGGATGVEVALDLVEMGQDPASELYGYVDRTMEIHGDSAYVTVLGVRCHMRPLAPVGREQANQTRCDAIEACPIATPPQTALA